MKSVMDFKLTLKFFIKIPKIIKLFPRVKIYNEAISNSNGKSKFNISLMMVRSFLSKFDKIGIIRL